MKGKSAKRLPSRRTLPFLHNVVAVQTCRQTLPFPIARGLRQHLLHKLVGYADHFTSFFEIHWEVDVLHQEPSDSADARIWVDAA